MSIGPSEFIFIFGLCMILMIPTIITFVMVSIRSRKKLQPAIETRRQCPYCAEWIKPEAKICRYCKRELTIIDLK